MKIKDIAKKARKFAAAKKQLRGKLEIEIERNVIGNVVTKCDLYGELSVPEEYIQDVVKQGHEHLEEIYDGLLKGKVDLRMKYAEKFTSKNKDYSQNKRKRIIYEIIK